VIILKIEISVSLHGVSLVAHSRSGQRKMRDAEEVMALAKTASRAGSNALHYSYK